MHNHATVEIVNKKGETKAIPKVANEYRSHMWYVDSNDKDVSYFRIGRVSKRWYQPIFWHLLDLTILNAYMVFKFWCEKKKKKMKIPSRKEYRISLSKELTRGYNNREIGITVDTTSMHLVRKDALGRKKCHFEGCNAKVNTFCQTCEVHICILHFANYHEGVNRM